MRTFDYGKISGDLRTNDVCNSISAIHEFRGKQTLFLSARPDALDALREIAKIQSTSASNRIEGIQTTDARLKALMAEKTEPRNRREAEIAGYRDVLTTIHESHDSIPLAPNTILQFHRDLCRHVSPGGIGGRWKNSDNLITETDASGVSRIRFRPLPAFETPDGVERLCRAFREARDRMEYDELLLIPLFVLDFLCIHPFADGNGRMSRLLTLLLLYQAGYLVGRYVSLEMQIEASKETYYEALRDASEGWLENANDPGPFVRYTLGVILKCYRLFESRVTDVIGASTPKTDRLRRARDEMLGSFTKARLKALCPDISETTLERTLRQWLDAGEIRKIGGGRGTAYAKVQ